MAIVIEAQQVYALRKVTGAPLMHCKRVLLEANGDVEQAKVLLRKQGLAGSVKKSSREAKQGIVVAAQQDATVVMIEVNCETDFVARNEQFKDFVQQVAQLALQHKVNQVEALLALELEGKTLELVRQEKVSTLGENIKIRRIAFHQDGGICYPYDHGGKIAAWVVLEKDDQELGPGLAMHVAAMHPVALNEAQIAPELLERERAVQLEVAQALNKPEHIMQRVIDGQIKKFIDERTLLGQKYVLTPDKKITKVLDDAHNKVISFVRFEVGEED
jgi:elongation factor Ts